MAPRRRRTGVSRERRALVLHGRSLVLSPGRRRLRCGADHPRPRDDARRTSEGGVSSVSRFDHTALDDVIHGRLRLGIMAYLSTVSPVPFVELKAKVNATDGNLSTHISKLEEAG